MIRSLYLGSFLAAAAVLAQPAPSGETDLRDGHDIFQARELRHRANLGVFTHVFGRAVALYGAGLGRLSPTPENSVRVEPPKSAQARCALWVDAIEGEPVSFQGMLDDLSQVKVVFLGEIRAIARRGLAHLPPEERSSLPAEIDTHDPHYQRWLNKILGVHMAFAPEQLEAAFHAQVARDETMADRLAQFLGSPAGRGRTAVVVCGSGHCQYGLGMPARVSRRIPGITERIVLFSESGDLQLSDQERKQARAIEVTHEFLREIGRPPGDYFQVTAPEPDPAD